MNILIADDRQLDRTALKDSVTEIFPDCAIWEVASTKQLFSDLTESWDLLFLDISFSGNHEPDDDGLYALLEIVNSYPALPVCIVTGHYKEKLPKFIQKFLGKTLQVVNFLDKANYSDNDLKTTVSMAQEYQSSFKKNIAEKRALDDLLLETAESAKQKIVASVFSEFHDRLTHADMVNKAFTGNDWASRIEAENQLTNGVCNVNAVLLCIEMDRLIQELCPNESGIFANYNQRRDYIANQFKIGWLDKGLMREAWSTRNKIVHAEIVADREDAHQLMRCVGLLLKNLPKNGSSKNNMKHIPVPGHLTAKIDLSKTAPT
jgi:hypothetical protein